MKKLLVAILLVLTLSAFAQEIDNRERITVDTIQKDGQATLQITYNINQDMETWFVVRRNAGDTEGYLVGPNQIDDMIYTVSIKKAWLWFGTKKIVCDITNNSLKATVKKPEKNGDYYFSFQVETSTGKTGFSLIDAWSIWAFDPGLEKSTRPNKEFRLGIDATKGTVVPRGNIKQ